jgi:putative transposase
LGSLELLKNTAKLKINAMGYYNLAGKCVTSFPESSRQESIINFIRNVKKNNPNKTIIIVLDNLKSRKMEDVKAEVERLVIELVFLLPYSPNLNLIEYLWKNIKRDISTTFVRYMDDMRSTIKKAFYRLTKKVGLAAAWRDKFLVSCFNYTDFCILL